MNFQTKRIHQRMSELAKLLDLEFDGDAEDLRLHFDLARTNAKAMGKKEYGQMEKELQDYSIERDGYTIYAWCDVSGFKYWNKEDEYNYIMITLVIKDLSKMDINKLKLDLAKAKDEFIHYDAVNYECYQLEDQYK